MAGRNKTTVGGDVRAALGLAIVLTLAALAIDDGMVGLLVGFIVFLLVVYAMARQPIRHSMLAFTFFAIVLPNPGEGQPTKWEPPFTIVGAALLNHLNTVDRSGMLSAIPVSAMELLFGILFLIHLYRKSTRTSLEGDVLPTPQPLVRLAYLALATAMFTWVSGLVRGGDFSMSLWQLSAVIYLPITFLLFQIGFRGPDDLWALAKVYLAAAFYKCGLAVYVIQNIKVPMDPVTGSTRPAYATAHADSMLFAICFVIVIGLLIEQVNSRVKWLAAVALPILLAGTIANNRRLAWVQIGVVFFMLYLVSRETRLKKAIRRAVMVSIPIGLVYLAAGWNTMYGGFFKPARIVRSVVDADSDGSSQWREWENVNIISTFRDHPIFGTGYGHPFNEVIVLPAVDYSLERFIPHNSLLSLWGFTGLVGFAGLTLLWVGGVYFAMRAYHAAQDPRHRAGALVSFGAVPVYMAQSWGDLGLGSWTGVFLMASSLTVAGKLAVATGQWSGARTRPAHPGPRQRPGVGIGGARPAA